MLPFIFIPFRKIKEIIVLKSRFKSVYIIKKNPRYSVIYYIMLYGRYFVRLIDLLCV